MDNVLMTVLGLFLATILIFIFPLMSLTERNDDISQTIVQTATAEFVDKISLSGSIKPSDYEEYIQKLESTGNTFDVQIEVQHLDENFSKKNSTTAKDLIGENERYSTFSTEILDNMYLEDGSSQNYILKKGDNVIITAKNTNKTMAQTLRTFVYKITGKGTYQVIASSSGMVTNDGATMHNVEIGNSNGDEEYKERVYLYNYGSEFEELTGGWYPSIMDTWKNEDPARHSGAVYKKMSNYLEIGDNSILGTGAGGFTTGAKIKEIADYNYLYIKLKVTNCNQVSSTTIGFNAYLSTTPIFVEYKDYNNNRNLYKYKQVNQYQEFDDVDYQEKTVAQLKQIMRQPDNLSSSYYSSGKYNNIFKGRLWSSNQIDDYGDVVEVRIDLTDTIKQNIINNDGCHVSVSGYALENKFENTINIQVYQVYLSSEDREHVTNKTEEMTG